MKIPAFAAAVLCAARSLFAAEAEVECGGRLWRLPPGASLDGSLLTVSIPAELHGETRWATTEIDLAPFENRGFEASVRVRGENIAKPTQPWLGFKFMLSYRDRYTGAMRYPGGGAPLGSFDWRETSFRQMAWFRGADGPGILHLGLQGTSGTVHFDLSTLRIGHLSPIWPVTNQTHRCEYTRIFNAEAQRRRETGRDAPAARPQSNGRFVETPLPDKMGNPVFENPASLRLCVDSLRGFMSPSGRDMTEDDFATLASWGATLLRYQMVRDWHGVDTNQDLDEWDRWLDAKLDHVERVVLPLAKKYGIRVALDMHVTPGGRDASHETAMFHDARFADRFVESWRRIARRFKGCDVLYGYDLVNEPQQQRAAPSGLDGWNLQRRAAAAIREIDPDAPIIVECNANCAPPGYLNLSPFDLPNVIYEVHMYGPGDFTHQGIPGMSMERCRWPDASRGWDKDYLRKTLAPVREFQRRHGARIYVGEFSAVAWAEGAENWLRDATALFAEYGWDWTYHAFREWRGWSVEHDGPDIDHMVPSPDNPRKRALLEGFNARRPAEQPAAPPYRPVGPETGVRGEATGFFHVEKIDGRDWMVDPVGRGVYLAGVDWCMPQGMFCEPLGYAPYGKTVKEKYASRDEWAENAASRLTSWGFDFLAVGTGPQMRYRTLAHADGADSLYFSTHLCRGDDPERWISPYRNAPGTAFPNVFHPDFEKTCDELARKRCAPNIGDPWLVGYFLDNELRWWGLGDSATGLFDLVRTLPPEHSARKALAAFLAERGLSTNSQLSTNINKNPANSVNPVENGSAHPAAPREVPAATKRAFVALIAERYFSTLCSAIRKADPDHLILGSRFAGMDFAPEILSACGRHCDVVSVNVYPWADLDTGVVLEKRGGVPLADAFRAFREKAGGDKPLLLTEWSFPALDSGLPCTYGAGQRFHTQAERALASEMLLRTVMALPFFVGDDFFMWQDDPALGFNKDFHENSNYGLVNVDDEPYHELTAMFARVHAEFAEEKPHAEFAEDAEGKPHAEFAEGAEGKPHAEFAEGAEESGRDVSTKRPPHGRAVGASLPALSERERFFAGAANLANDVNGVNHANAVGFRQEDDGSWTLSNGLVRISGRIGGSRMADEIAYGSAAPVGRWNALLQWNDNGVTQWTAVSRVTDVDFARDEATGIGTVIIRAVGFARAAPSAAEGSEGAARPSFAITDRLSLAPGSSDILAEIVRLENTGAEPIEVEYLFLRPLAAEKRPAPCRGATVPNLWKGPVEGWWRLSDGSRWGVASRDPGVVSATLWFRKEDATQHPDVRCLGVPPFTLVPGASFHPPHPIGSRIRLLRP